MSRETGTRVAPDAWKARVLRMTSFHPTGTTAPPDDWWAMITGQEPEARNSKPKAGEHVISGKWLDAQLVLQVNSREARIDWLFAEPPAMEDESGHPPYPEKAASFLDLMQTWLRSDSCPYTTSRLALGGVLALPVLDLSEGYRAISNYLNFDIDYANSSDFMFQINRKRASASLPPWEINRLTKWAVIHQTMFRFALQVPSGQEVATPVTVPAIPDGSPSVFAAQIELDINTAPRPSQFIDKKALPDLIAEMHGLMGEIVVQGDIQ